MPSSDLMENLVQEISGFTMGPKNKVEMEVKFGQLVWVNTKPIIIQGNQLALKKMVFGGVIASKINMTPWLCLTLILTLENGSKLQVIVIGVSHEAAAIITDLLEYGDSLVNPM